METWITRGRVNWLTLVKTLRENSPIMCPSSRRGFYSFNCNRWNRKPGRSSLSAYSGSKRRLMRAGSGGLEVSSDWDAKATWNAYRTSAFCVRHHGSWRTMPSQWAQAEAALYWPSWRNTVCLGIGIGFSSIRAQRTTWSKFG